MSDEKKQVEKICKAFEQKFGRFLIFLSRLLDAEFQFCFGEFFHRKS